MALFTMRVEAGALMLGRCAFLTITYMKGSCRLDNVNRVTLDWKELWRRLKASSAWWRSVQWLRVMELTKAGTPHYHLILGAVPLTRLVNCCLQRPGEPKKAYKARYGRNLLKMMEVCGCLAHEVSRVWWKLTGDSYIVHAIDVNGAKGAGEYMAKYMVKAFSVQRAVALGMSRRWSSSKGWPGNGRLQLAQTAGAGWMKTDWYSEHAKKKELGQFKRDGTPASQEDLLERVGPEGILEVARKRKYERIRRLEQCFT